MNIFHLSDSPIESAIWQHDRHVVKMTLETAQLLSTAIWHNADLLAAWESVHGPMRPGIDSIDSGGLRLYKSISNPNHPSAVWVRANERNFIWTVIHMNALIGEYHRRFLKPHGCDSVRWAMNAVACKLAGVDRFYYSEREEISLNKWNRTTHIQPEICTLADSHDPFVFCGPDYCRVGSFDVVDAYRIVYMREKIFQNHVKWTRCDDLPDFLAKADSRYPSQILTRIAALRSAHAAGLKAAMTISPAQAAAIARPKIATNVTRFGGLARA